MHKRPLSALRCAIAVTVTVTVGLSLSLTASAVDPLTVGVVYIGPIDDDGWTYQQEQGRKVLAAERHGVFAVGYASDMAYFGPKAMFTSIVYDWASHCIQATQSLIDHRWKPQDY
ncbi:hypothetical protein SAMN04487857_1268 [Pseudomonas sp. ok272]|nr:hypothetical protein SAMN04487857_1268 [Pseudomonas sp. ok272]SFN40224.1 hypothetical protein SAMN04487858_12519 [Pseudomonas sp. ok602]